MTFVGKILVVLIMLMSFAWLGLAAAVYSTHKNWHEVVFAKEAKAGKEVGLLVQLQNRKAENERLNMEREQLEKDLRAEKTTRQMMIARAETTRQLDQKENNELKAKVKAETDKSTAADAAVTATQGQIDSLNKEIAEIRETLKTTRQALDETFATMLTQTDRNHALLLIKTRLEEQARVLAEDLRKAETVLMAHNLNKHDRVDGAAPRGGAVVTAVRNDGASIFVTVSIGSDDGIRKGHQMNVYRGDKYLGRVTVSSVEVNRCVAISERKFYVAPFQVGDKTETITAEAPLVKQATNSR